MAKRSAGVLLYRLRAGVPEVLLAHPGGPFWARKDEGAWSIPKGEIDEGECAEEAARREFFEETGFSLKGELTALGEFRQPSGKRVLAYALEGDVDPSELSSNFCQIEWPPKTGRLIDIPEIDRAAWFSLPEAMGKIVKGQRGALEALARRLEIR
ncbi:NUDIX domain-containing protein [Methylocystis sp. IM3]|uniref:NUDIX domain-containing protein n=1 Tax=unclassified Methylocystis TaxID=2625913 RepID=UPI000FB284CC|nr:MAG: NUDIX domain-containing protein [Hyphomicrobiales bacterium]